MDHWQGYKRPASEQEYSDNVQIGSDIEPTRDELSDLSVACGKLWDLDLNRLVPGRDYRIDCGEGKKVYGRDDMAEGSLFSWLSENVLRRPTYSRFCSLLDNYNPNEGSKEVVTAEERQEQVAFVEEISRTAPIKYLHRYLALKGVVSDDYEEFKRMLVNLWFELYGRGGTRGSSSAFEHVFVGEIKQRGEEEVSGFHNWLQVPKQLCSAVMVTLLAFLCLISHDTDLRIFLSGALVLPRGGEGEGRLSRLYIPSTSRRTGELSATLCIKMAGCISMRLRS